MRKRTLQSLSRSRNQSEKPRDAALRILKIRGEMSIVELSRSLKLTQTAVRRHLQNLQSQGLVSMFIHHQSKGRPMNKYRLTEKASTDYFPTGYEEVAARLLDTVFDTTGHAGVFNGLTAANQHLISTFNTQLSGKPLRARIEAICDHFRDSGYMTDFRELPRDRFFLYHQNCAIYNLANKYRQLCFMELKLIEALAHAKVTRQQYIFKNQPICGYLIGPRLESYQ